MASENTTTTGAKTATVEPDPAERQPGCKPIWERLAEMGEALSPEDKAKLPPDLAEQHDHYLYGWPKQSRL